MVFLGQRIPVPGPVWQVRFGKSGLAGADSERGVSPSTGHRLAAFSNALSFRTVETTSKAVETTSKAGVPARSSHPGAHMTTAHTLTTHERSTIAGPPRVVHERSREQCCCQVPIGSCWFASPWGSV
jgi:hypothetical protein